MHFMYYTCVKMLLSSRVESDYTILHRVVKYSEVLFLHSLRPVLAVPSPVGWASQAPQPGGGTSCRSSLAKALGPAIDLSVMVGPASPQSLLAATMARCSPLAMIREFRIRRPRYRRPPSRRSRRPRSRSSCRRTERRRGRDGGRRCTRERCPGGGVSVHASVLDQPPAGP